MNRIYLDWNAFSYLKNLIRNKEKSDIVDLVENNPSAFLFPYSPAHIQDLIKGAHNPKNLEYIKTDLDFIDKLSRQHCIQVDLLDKSNVKPFIGSSHILFESLVKDEYNDFFNPTNLEKTDNPLLPNLGKTITEAWKKTPIDLKFISDADKYEGAKEFYDKYFKRTQAENNMYNMMLDFSDFYKELKQNPDIYNSLGELLRTQLNLQPREVSNFKNPIDELNKIFKNSIYNMDFEQLSSINSNETDNFLNNHFVKYAVEYGNLDMSGFHPDKLNKKNLYTNFTNDSHHSFYAGFCDCLVSQDKKILYKSEALYQKYGIETKTFTPLEFYDYYSKLVNIDLNISDFIKTINNTIENNLKTEIKEHDFEDARLFLFKPENKILSYFNFLYVAFHKEERQTIFLRQVHKNFSYFNFYIEWENLINKCAGMFGNDLNGKSVFEDDEKELINKDEWTGRIWITSDFIIELVFDKLTYGLELIFEQITDDYLNELKKKHSC